MKKKLLFLSTSLVMLSMLISSCGPTVKVNIKGTKDGVTVTTTQHAQDSSSLNIHVNPNINFNNPL